MTAPAFLAERYVLEARGRAGEQLILARLEPREAEALGPALAGIDPWATHAYAAQALSAYLGKDEPGAPRFALRAGDSLAGAVGLRLDWLKGPYLQLLGLLPGYQGCGFGAAVLTWMQREACAVSERNLWVAASDFNSGALRFYERHGFVRVAALEGLVAEGRSEILLRKRL
jgi:GNAT superfamily N-acetyltransferase